MKRDSVFLEDILVWREHCFVHRDMECNRNRTDMILLGLS